MKAKGHESPLASIANHMYNDSVLFAWDESKNLLNQAKHGVSFEEAEYAFKTDHKRIIAADPKHSLREQRLFCYCQYRSNILTIRFVIRDGAIRIIGAGYWRKGRKIYEQTNSN